MFNTTIDMKDIGDAIKRLVSAGVMAEAMKDAPVKIDVRAHHAHENPQAYWVRPKSVLHMDSKNGYVRLTFVDGTNIQFEADGQAVATALWGAPAAR